MDILQPLPLDKWPMLRDKLKQDWPNYAYYYNWVSNAINWKKKNPTIEHDIYCPFRDYDTGVFIGIPSSFTLYKLVIFSLNESKNLLKKVLSETKVIDWDRELLLFPGVHENCVDELLNLLKLRNRTLTVTSAQEMIHYFKSKEDCANIKFEVPEECELKYLDSSHLNLVNSYWHFSTVTHPALTRDILKKYITMNKGIGLFLKSDDSLVSWALQTEWSGLGAVATLKEHRGKGYGKIVVKTIVKELAEKDDLDAALFVLANNKSAIRMFESVGFTRQSKLYWIGVVPKKSSKL